MVECKQEWRRGKRGGRYERLVRSDQGRDGKDDEVDYVFQKDARRGDTRRRHTGGGRGGYNSATRKPVFHRQPLSRETARELRTTTSKKDESRLCRPPRIAVFLSLSLFAVIDHEKDGEKKKKRRRRRRLALERSATRPLENERRD